ncbi:SGNH/GDSL hydrolase family protein [Streptomyces gobiensis]|uniref:SGNH/GDSL hydrolase family protein n=1 Tax=Streptomyces gobiensis TaxID=2875706 RepID=UPI001E565A15|nr:SGNH/GDSL hydrolase family protein [Streptomyces gobiensis]UGY95277.1 SGNH/GDSL hydrolase family protein [Streptomyces gobiensis]
MSAPTAPTVAVAGPGAESGHKEPLPLEQLFNNRAVSDDPRPDEADFDGAGNSLSAQDLAAAGWRPGRALRIDAARLRWPAARPGEPDNVRSDGQRVRLRGRGNAISFLAAGSSPDGAMKEVSGRGTVRYSDGSQSPYTLTAGDWRGGLLSTKAVALPHLNTGTGQRSEKVRLYAVTVPVKRDRMIDSVVLPPDPGPRADLHVFAASVRAGAAGWTGSWAASTGGYTEVGPWTDRTLRLVVRTSVGGTRARIRLGNTFADIPLEIGHASVAVRGEGAAAAGQPVPLTFGGRDGTRIPAGAQTLSDPVALPGHGAVPADTDLLVSLHLPGTVTAAPVHGRAIQRSYASADGSGDRTGQRGGEGYRAELTFWPFLTGVEVSGGPGSVVTLGDSITDGVRSTEGANRRWPNVLARRLLDQDPDDGEAPRYGVLNHGISANRIVTDRYDGDGISKDTGGVSAQHRLERDVLAQPRVRTVVLFEGINDIRWDVPTDQVTAGMRAIAERSRERGVRVVAATLTPCGGWADCTAEVERRRMAVNAFIREHDGVFDAVLDFDAALRDPQRPDRLLPRYDSGDHLHPGDAGLRALAESVELNALVPG